MTLRTKILQLAAAATLALTGGTANAATSVDLGFILDGSGSVGSTDFNAARNALAAAIQANVPTNDPDFTYTVGVSVFGATGVVGLAAITITDAASKAAAVAGIQAITYGSGYSTGATCFNCGFAKLNEAFGGGSSGDLSIVNMTTDGNNNTGGVPADNTILQNASWDSLSFEAVGGFVNTAPLVALGYDTGGPGATLIGNVNQITDPLNDAFVIQVNDFGTQYAAVIDRKLRASTGPIPLPAGFPLLAGGIMFFGFVARRRKAAAA